LADGMGVQVLSVPEHAWVVDQGALGDAMYYVVSGRLKERFLSGGAPADAGREYGAGDSFG
jgi:CRP-like cAMP-binding protein